MYPSTGLQTALNKMREMSVDSGSIYHQYVPVVTDSTTIGELLTGNTQNMKAIADRDAEIDKLKDRNDKLVAANGALLQKVPMGYEAVDKKKSEEAPQPKISLKDAFDEKGNFRH